MRQQEVDDKRLEDGMVGMELEEVNKLLGQMETLPGYHNNYHMVVKAGMRYRLILGHCDDYVVNVPGCWSWDRQRRSLTY